MRVVLVVGPQHQHSVLFGGCSPQCFRYACSVAAAVLSQLNVGMRRRVGAHSDHLIVIIEDRGERIGPLALVVPFHQQTAVVITDGVTEASDIGCDHWSSARLRLERNESERLVVGGHSNDVGDAVPAEQL